jgi:hypothetical protein
VYIYRNEIQKLQKRCCCTSTKTTRTVARHKENQILGP